MGELRGPEGEVLLRGQPVPVSGGGAGLESSESQGPVLREGFSQ